MIPRLAFALGLLALAWAHSHHPPVKSHRFAIIAEPRPTEHARRLWASDQYHRKHPDVSSAAAYKELCRQASWRYQC